MGKYINPFKVGDVVHLKEDSAPNPAWGIPSVSAELIGVVVDIKGDTILVEYAGFLISWAYAKYFELAE